MSRAKCRKHLGNYDPVAVAMWGLLILAFFLPFIITAVTFAITAVL